MVGIEENEDLLKALDRLELILREIESSEDPALDQRRFSYFYTLFKFYSRIGLDDIATNLANRYGFRIGQTPNIKKEIYNKTNLSSLITIVTERLKKQKPTPLIHSMEDLCKYLTTSKDEEIIENANELRNLINEINKFIIYWVRFSELIDRTRFNKYLVNDLIRIDKPQQYTKVLLNLTVNLCQTYNHSLLPQFLYHLGMCQKKVDDSCWIETLIDSCLEAAEYNDPVNFLGSFKEVKGFLSQDNNFPSGIPEHKLFNLFTNTITLCERIIERITFPEARDNFIQKMSQYIDFATLQLAQLNNTRDKGSWIFRGVNLLKARSLTLLRVELPSRSDLGKDHWLELKKILMEENELILIIKDVEKNAIPQEILDRLENISQTKYELFLKIDRWGRGSCLPLVLKNSLNLHENKKISIISFLISEKNLLITGLSNYKEDIWFEYYEIKIDEIDSLINGCLDDIEFKDNNSYLREAFIILIKPIIKHIEGSDLLYIIPDAKLYNLPFHALIDDKGQFFIEKHEIAYVPSSLILWRLLNRSAEVSVSEKSLAFGCLGQDIDWKNKQQALRELGIQIVNTSNQELRNLIDTFYMRKILYFIGHGYLPEKNQSPFDACLALTDINDNTLSIKARDLLEWGPKSNFIFLNSCSLGECSVHGKDIYGFPFSIIGAANSSCLVAVKPIDIEFAHSFAVKVLKNLKQGNDRTAAIAKTIRECIDSPQKSEWNLPHYWAPYFFYGDFRPL